MCPAWSWRTGHDDPARFTGMTAGIVLPHNRPAWLILSSDQGFPDFASTTTSSLTIGTRPSGLSNRSSACRSGTSFAEPVTTASGSIDPARRPAGSRTEFSCVLFLLGLRVHLREVLDDAVVEREDLEPVTLAGVLLVEIESGSRAHDNHRRDETPLSSTFRGPCPGQASGTRPWPRRAAP